MPVFELCAPVHPFAVVLETTGRVPPVFGRRLLAKEQYDVLLPTHEQVYLLSRFRDAFAPQVGVALPEFAAVERLQNKAEFSRLLTEMDLPQPATTVVRTPDELARAAAVSVLLEAGPWNGRRRRVAHRESFRSWSSDWTASPQGSLRRTKRSASPAAGTRRAIDRAGGVQSR